MYNIASKVKNHRLYSDFIKIKNRLADHQFVCWIVGGAVRDFCIDREVHEFDLVTDASTEVLKQLFPNAILVGESFGVLKIPASEGGFFDLSSYREESDYQDGRRPSKVRSSIPTQDAKRRDFTLNSLYWSEALGTVIDYTGGIEDLFNKRLVCVGNPNIRFAEDFLRLVRLARFSCQLGFSIEDTTLEAAKKMLNQIDKVSGERIWQEFKKIDMANAWHNCSNDHLIWNLLKQVFSLNFEINVDLKIPCGADIALVCCLVSGNKDLSAVFRNRLKVSKNELKWYQAVRTVLLSLQTESLYEVAYQIEKNEDHLQAYNHLSKLKVVDPNKIYQLAQFFGDNKTHFVEAKDLLGIVPNNAITEELKEIRIGQFSKRYKNSDEVWSYLKKKYAKMEKKP